MTAVTEDSPPADGQQSFEREEGGAVHLSMAAPASCKVLVL